MADEDRIAAILADWQERNERGEAPTPPEAIREHPDLAEDLLARFSAMELLDQGAGRPPVARPEPPRLLGEFRLLREIGRGGMGIVCEAEQTSMGRKVALDADGNLKVMDFGLARMQGEGPSVTVAGDLLGTPAYMSPEQAGADGERIDARTDVYSLGATLYEVLTLRPPFRGKDAQAGALLGELVEEVRRQRTQRGWERPCEAFGSTTERAWSERATAEAQVLYPGSGRLALSRALVLFWGGEEGGGPRARRQGPRPPATGSLRPGRPRAPAPGHETK